MQLQVENRILIAVDSFVDSLWELLSQQSPSSILTKAQACHACPHTNVVTLWRHLQCSQCLMPRQHYCASMKRARV